MGSLFLRVKDIKEKKIETVYVLMDFKTKHEGFGSLTVVSKERGGMFFRFEGKGKSKKKEKGGKRGRRKNKEKKKKKKKKIKKIVKEKKKKKKVGGVDGTIVTNKNSCK